MSRALGDQTETVVSAVSIAADTIEVSFMVLPQDYRAIADSPVGMMRTLVIDRANEAYRDEIDALVNSAESLVDDVLEDWSDAQPIRPTQDEDDDKGMGE